MERLVSTLLPRVRQIVNDAVGQEGGGTSAVAASNFLGSPVLTGGATVVTSTHLDYDLDDQAFELAQISEGYIGRMCSSLDELMEPMRVHLVSKLSDDLLIGILGGVSKRLEAVIRKVRASLCIHCANDVLFTHTFSQILSFPLSIRANSHRWVPSVWTQTFAT
jgi:hypothetical protein